MHMGPIDCDMRASNYVIMMLTIIIANGTISKGCVSLVGLQVKL